MERTFLNGLVQRELGIFFFRNFPGKRASVNSNKNKPARAENVRNHVAFFNFTSDWLRGWPGPSSLDQSQTEVIKAKPM